MLRRRVVGVKIIRKILFTKNTDTPYGVLGLDQASALLSSATH